jgi:formylglycine-generating enzyme required for sulfatase activity
MREGHETPNGYDGNFGVHGHVYQWCEDWWNVVTEPTRVVRGGSLSRTGPFCRAAFRAGYVPSFRGWHLGFRLARVPTSG